MEPINENLDEDYEPVDRNVYSYNAINSLQTNIDDLLDINQTYTVHVCTFEVNNEYKYPLLKYLLCKHKPNNKCYFPSFPIANVTSDDIILKATNFINKILDNISQTSDDVTFNGFKLFDNNIYIFFDCTQCKIKQPELLWNANTTWFAIIDEIVNKKSICNILIDECVTNFFIKNNDLCYLQNGKNENYILPIIAYVSRDEPKLHFTFVFGVSKSLNTSILGAYYYFTNYKNSIDTNSTINANPDLTNVSHNLFKRGIIRFALFIEKTKRIENLPDDNQNSISDYNGNWATDYDSAYIGNILLDDGTHMKDTPMIVIRDYEQQVPLSYHYIQNVVYDRNLNTRFYDII